MFKDEEGAGILGCIGGGTGLGITGAVSGGLIGIILGLLDAIFDPMGVIGWIAAVVAAPMFVTVTPWYWMVDLFSGLIPLVTWTLPATALLTCGGGVIGAALGGFFGTLVGLFADWAGTCLVIANTCEQAIGRTVGGLFGAMGK